MSQATFRPNHPPATPAAAVCDCLAHLFTALHRTSLYPADHPACRDAVATLADELAKILSRDATLAMAVVDDHLLLSGYPQGENKVRVAGGLRDLHRWSIEHLAFDHGVTLEEIHALFGLLHRRPADGENATTLLDHAGVTHITVGRLATGGNAPVNETVGIRLYRQAVEEVAAIHQQAGEHRQVDLGQARHIVEAVIEDQRRGDQLQALTWLKSHDDYTYTHVLNVCILTVAQARTLGLPEKRLNAIGVAALLHDTGKCFVPPELLRKPGKLTPAEFEIVKQHPVLGAKLLRSIPDIDDLTILVAYEHHMRFDGGGYPERAHPRMPNLASRLCTIADYYDALRTIRSYKKEITPDEALRIMSRGAGTVLDPVLFKHFVEMVGLYPRGCLVQLTDGRIGVVVATRAGFATLPMVRVVTDEAGALLSDPVEVDLAAGRADDQNLSIDRAIDPDTAKIAPEAYL